MPANHPPELPDPIRREIQRLKTEFSGIFSANTIEQFVETSWLELSRQEPRVDHYRPVLVRRFARERLRAVARIEGALMTDHAEILFVCVHNAGRSQMAAALTKHLGGERVHVRSAGSAPRSEINPQVVAVIDEMGLDLGEEFPKPLSDEFVRAADVVITMGCGDACPVYPGKRYLDWDVDDPAGQDIATVRRIRDDIQARVVTLLENLGVQPAARTEG